MKTSLALALCAAAGSAAAAEPDPEMGELVFRGYCAVCHGKEARGDGPMAPALKVPPADLTGLSAANGGTFPVFTTVQRIDGRDPLLSHGGDMPLFGDLFTFPDGAIASESGQPIITSAPIADVAAWLETIQE